PTKQTAVHENETTPPKNGARLHNIKLTYTREEVPLHARINGAEYKYTVTAENLTMKTGNYSTASTGPRYKKGDRLTFQSDDGYITVEVKNNIFKPSVFSTDKKYCPDGYTPGQAIICQEDADKIEFWCGFSFGYPGKPKIGAEDPGK